MIFTNEARDWLRHAIAADSPNFEVAQLKGSTSSSLFLIASSHNSGTEKFVLRVLDNQKWLTEEPDLAAHEAAALEEAARAGLRAPRVVNYSSEDVGFGAPVVLMSFLEGRIELQPRDFPQWLNELAVQLATIHRHPATDFPWVFSSWVNREALKPPEWSTVPHAWERAIETVLAPPPKTSDVFIHRDYHPVNVLWDGDKISGIVDWINACRGPIGADVAHCCMDLALMYGADEAEQFLKQYREVADGFEFHPYWELDAILDMCLPEFEFYEPWREFGMDFIPAAVLRRRTDEHLERVLRLF